MAFEELIEYRNSLLKNELSAIVIIKALEQDFYKNERISLKEFMDKLEKEIIVTALLKVNGSQCEAAKILGMRSSTLHEKIKRYHISLETIMFVRERPDEFSSIDENSKKGGGN